MNITNNDTKKTKKNRNNKIDKAKMWNTFDEEFNNKEPIECVYRKIGEREFCDSCESSLSITEAHQAVGAFFQIKKGFYHLI